MTLTEEFKEYINHIDKWWGHKEKSEANNEASSIKEEDDAWQKLKIIENNLVERLKARSYNPHHITHDQRVYKIDYENMQILYIYAPTTEMLDRDDT